MLTRADLAAIRTIVREEIAATREGVLLGSDDAPVRHDDDRVSEGAARLLAAVRESQKAHRALLRDPEHIALSAQIEQAKAARRRREPDADARLLRATASYDARFSSFWQRRARRAFRLPADASVSADQVMEVHRQWEVMKAERKRLKAARARL